MANKSKSVTPQSFVREEGENRFFTESGLAVLKGDRSWLLVCCSPNGLWGSGGHGHLDKLSFEFCVDGEEIVVDPGTFVYTSDPEWRNALRSSRAHNCWQSELLDRNCLSDLFKMGCRLNTRVTAFDAGGIKAEYYCPRFNFGLSRRIRMTSKGENVEFRLPSQGLCWKLSTGSETVWFQDEMIGDWNSSIIQTLTLAPSCQIKEITSHRAVLSAQGVEVVVETQSGLHLRKGERLYCPAYGEKVETEALIFQASESQVADERSRQSG